MNVIVVVPDEFANFSKISPMLLYSLLIEKLRSNNATDLVGASIIAGQGLGEMEIDHAFCLAVSIGLSQEFAHWRHWRANTGADRSQCHKHRPENVLISTPRKVTTDRYSADLLVHSRNEFMLDHLTGLHIQGMVLAEACRQMFLAVTERFCLNGYTAAQRYFVIKEMNMRYLEFAFPLPAEIRYHLLDRQQPKPDRVSIKADMEVWQNDRPVAGMAVQFTVFDAKFLNEREATLAESALEQCLKTTAAEIDDRSSASAGLLTTKRGMEVQ